MNYKYTDYNDFDELMDCDSQTAIGGSFDGAPNPIEYIDLTDFGGDLIAEGDASIVCLLQNGKVVTTSYGW